jgi:hypothetical protein
LKLTLSKLETKADTEGFLEAASWLESQPINITWKIGVEGYSGSDPAQSDPNSRLVANLIGVGRVVLLLHNLLSE